MTTITYRNEQPPTTCLRGMTSSEGCEFLDHDGTCMGVCYPTYPPQYDKCELLRKADKAKPDTAKPEKAKQESAKPEEPVTENINPLTYQLFVCSCGDVSHQFVATYDNDDPDWDKVYLEVKLNRNLPWYKRLCVAFRYLFLRTPSRFGDYDEVILDKSHIPALEKLIDALKHT